MGRPVKRGVRSDQKMRARLFDIRGGNLWRFLGRWGEGDPRVAIQVWPLFACLVTPTALKFVMQVDQRTNAYVVALGNAPMERRLQLRRTMKTRLLASSASLAFAFVSVVACGGSDSSEFGGGGGADDRTIKGPNGEIDSSGTLGAPHSTLGACVSSTANAALEKVNLVFMYDRSGSMGDTQNSPPFDPTLKWQPVGAGMNAFFSDPRSATLSASLQFFPLGSDVASNCAAAYDAPKVPLTALTSSAPFTQAISTTSPKGGTPTLPALKGAIAYAKSVAAQHQGEHAAVVLVTDGEPGFQINGSFQPGCDNNDIAHVSAEAAAAFKGSPSIPTYVIGVGPSLSNLNQIASAGGTKSAFMVSVADPSKTSTVFQQALDQIRGQIMSCDFALPPPPAGKQLDVQAVNVAFQAAGGAETILGYSSDCASGQGWRYDNVTAPTRVQLCPATCDAARKDAKAKLTLAFGCRTNGIVR